MCVRVEKIIRTTTQSRDQEEADTNKFFFFFKKKQKNPEKQKRSANSGEENQLYDCTMTRPRSVVQQLYIAQHGRQEIDI